MREVDFEKLIAEAAVGRDEELARVLGHGVKHPAYGKGRIQDIQKSEEGRELLLSVGFGKINKVFSITEFRREFLQKQYVMNQPSVPDLESFTSRVKEIFDNRWLTNFGGMHEEFSESLREIMDAEFVLPVTNATFGLTTLLNAMDLHGEMLTVPYTFPATYHALIHARNVSPRFVDVRRDNFGMDPDAAARAITERTAGILAVHAYGFPAAVEELSALAQEHDLPLIFDAAACFGVRKNGLSITQYGDASVLSFHATKVFNTAEGGAIICRDEALYDRCKLFINFGILGEDKIEFDGLNGKMDELRCALGLANLGQVEIALEKRKRVVESYLETLRELDHPQISYLPSLYDTSEQTLNYSYFPIIVTPSDGLDRDMLNQRLRRRGVFSRTYYYPTARESKICSDMEDSFESTPVSTQLSKEVLCLPVNPDFDEYDCACIMRELQEAIRET
ncbi:MAG: DegT/DnrJ/EryC1/StrS family aminotransferase [Myxococcota bacterium]|nr:DegT/DnrJ/EryC1/StrS family aminotransferase [Myxococcota bacterium]